MDVILTGKRPQPLCSSAGETIDESRGLLHGGYSGSGKYVDEAYVIDLKEKVINSLSCLQQIIVWSIDLDFY